MQRGCLLHLWLEKSEIQLETFHRNLGASIFLTGQDLKNWYTDAIIEIRYWRYRGEKSFSLSSSSLAHQLLANKIQLCAPPQRRQVYPGLAITVTPLQVTIPPWTMRSIQWGRISRNSLCAVWPPTCPILWVEPTWERALHW